MRPTNLVVAGVGGQGVLFATRFLAQSAFDAGLPVTVGEVHGMAQRGGTVVTTARFGEVESPLIGKGEADAILGLEPAEAVRVVDRAHEGTMIVLDTLPVPPVSVALGSAPYPRIESLLGQLTRATSRVIPLDAHGIARSVGNPVVANMVLVGALLGTHVLPVDLDAARRTLARAPPSRLSALNLEALEIGWGMTANNQVPEDDVLRSIRQASSPDADG